MDTIISDKSAMDPEVVVPEMSKTVPVLLWLGLPRCWGLAVFVVVGAALQLWGLVVTVPGLIITGLLACLRGSCPAVQKTGAGAWFTAAHHCTALACLASGMQSWMKSVIHVNSGGMRGWISGHLLSLPNLLPTLVLLFVTLLFSLGLERSKLLRVGLFTTITATFFAMAFGSWLAYSSDALSLWFLSTANLKHVVECTAFLTVVTAGAMNPRPNTRQLSGPSCVAVAVLLLSCMDAAMFLATNYYPNGQDSFQHNNSSESLGEGRTVAVFATRESVVTMATVCLSLSLVEVFSVGQQTLVSLAGHILPHQVARDSYWTGTQLAAILLTGVVSGVLANAGSVSTLLKFSSVTYLLSISCDLLSAVHHQYQPSYIPKHSVEQGDGGGSYQLVSDMAPLVDSAGSEPELSDDSGHSSDTDIDAAVHEYKESIKVVTLLPETIPVVEPTITTGHRVTLSLLIILLLPVVAGHQMAEKLFYLGILVTVVVGMTYLISRQPQQLDTADARPISPWRPCFLLGINGLLISQLITSIWPLLLAWSSIGLVLWLYNKRCQLRARLRGRANRTLMNSAPHLRTGFSFLPSYHKLSQKDPTYIIQ